MDHTGATSQTWFLTVQGADSPTIHPLRRGRTVIGRDATVDLRHPSRDVSGRHAAVVVADDGVHVEDLGSTNGTYVNSERVHSRRLAPGDVLWLGSAVMRLDTPETVGTAATHTAFSIEQQRAGTIVNAGRDVHHSTHSSTYVSHEEWHPWDELFHGPPLARLVIVAALCATLIGFGLWAAFIFSMWDAAPGFGEDGRPTSPLDDIPTVAGLPMPIVGFALFGGGAVVQGLAIYWSRAIRQRRGDDVGVMPRHSSSSRRRRRAW